MPTVMFRAAPGNNGPRDIIISFIMLILIWIVVFIISISAVKYLIRSELLSLVGTILSS